MNALAFLDGKKLVEEAVKRLEQKSSAEVVCVVATESGRYDRAESLVGLLFALAGLGAAGLAWEALHASTWGTPVPLWAQSLGVVVGFVFGLVLASSLHPLRRLLVGPREMEDEVQRGAAAAFTAARVGTTKGRTGVLVYVSLFERRVVVLLDSGVRAAVPDDFAKQLVEKAVAGLKAGQRSEVLAALVDQVAETLAAKLPPQAENPNELPDHVVALHPR